MSPRLLAEVAPNRNASRRRLRVSPLCEALEDRKLLAVDIGPIFNPANGHAYYRLTQSTWTAAESEAVGLGGHLVTVNDAAENQWVLDTFSNEDQFGLWIGLNDAANEKRFVWSSGEPVSYENWLPKQPDNAGNEDYVHLWVPTQGFPTYTPGKWNDLRDVATAVYPSKVYLLQGIVEVSGPALDLKINSAVATGSNILDVTYTIANAASTPFDVGFYKSTDASLDAGDTQLTILTIANPADLTLGTHTKSLLIGAGTGQVALPGMVAADLNLQYHLIAVLDPADRVAEDDVDPLNEDNTTALSGAYHTAGGPVFVHGTSQNDSYVLSHLGANLVIATSVNGNTPTSLSYLASDVASVRIRSQGNNDVIDSSAIAKPMTILSGRGDDIVKGGSGNDWVWGDDENDRIEGGAGNDSLYGGPGSDALFGSTGNDTLCGGERIGEFDSVVGGAGLDVVTANNEVNAWAVNSCNAGSLNSGVFSGVEDLVGGSLADTFAIAAGGLLSGKINGNGGTDTISFASYGAPAMIDLYFASATGMRGFLGVESFVGGSAADTLFGTNVPATWQITDTNAGSVGAVTFSGFENLVGGTRDDTFRFSNGKGVTGVIDGGDGVNTLDYSLYMAAVAVNLETGAASGVGGVASIQNAIGGSGADSLTGDEGDNLFLGNGGNDTLVGGPGGSDVLVGGVGNDTIRGSRSGRNLIIGGYGADVLIGGDDEDLILNGFTSFDAFPDALAAMRNEWKRTDQTYAQRIDHLLGNTGGGLNGTARLLPITVADDRDLDSITGGAGLDWFWSPLGELLDRVALERVKSA